MKVIDLIQELLKLPQDAPVVVNYKYLSEIEYKDSTYVINENDDDYTVDSAVVLE